MKTLKTILEEFDIPEFHDGECRVSLTGAGKCYCQITDIKELVVSSIKDALESCRVEKGEHICEDGEPPEGEICGERFYTDAWNANTTQYDENVKLFVGEEEV